MVEWNDWNMYKVNKWKYNVAFGYESILMQKRWWEFKLELIDSRQGSSDLEKVCDCVSHSIMLTELKFYDIIGKAHKQMKSYLKKKKHERVTLKTPIFLVSILDGEL